MIRANWVCHNTTKSHIKTWTKSPQAFLCPTPPKNPPPTVPQVHQLALVLPQAHQQVHLLPPEPPQTPLRGKTPTVTQEETVDAELNTFAGDNFLSNNPEKHFETKIQEPEEDFSHLSLEEQAVVRQISLMIRQWRILNLCMTEKQATYCNQFTDLYLLVSLSHSPNLSFSWG